MSVLQGIPHPLALLRDYLIRWRPPTNRVLKGAAFLKGLDVVENESFYSNYVDRNGKRSFCYRTGLGPRATETFVDLTAALKNASISFFRGGGADDWMKSIHIASRDTRLLVDLLRRKFAANASILVKLSDGEVVSCGDLGSKPAHYRQTRLTVLCVEKKAEASSTLACSWIGINIWKEVQGYSSQRIFETATFGPHLRRLRAETLERFLCDNTDIDVIDHNLGATPRFPIDVVYTWVNDKDPEWRKQKELYSGKAESNSDLSRSNLDERFTNRDELKYSMRSIELFAPFVRNIYLVTNGQIPSWLNTQNPRIKVVPHSEIYSKQDHLPTFNSSSIETQLHHIDGLAEHFLYFNDDFFLGDFCLPEDFFFANGAMKYFAAEQRAFEHDIDGTSEEYIAADANALALLKDHFGAFTRELMIHAPYPALRSVLYAMEEQFACSFDACASRRFRSHDDLRPIAFMQYHFGYQTRQAIPATISNRYLALWKPGIDRLFGDLLENRRYKTFCINDVGIAPSRTNWTNKQVEHFLRSYFPFKSSFEK